MAQLFPKQILQDSRGALQQERALLTTIGAGLRFQPGRGRATYDVPDPDQKLERCSDYRQPDGYDKERPRLSNVGVAALEGPQCCCYQRRAPS